MPCSSCSSVRVRCIGSELAPSVRQPPSSMHLRPELAVCPCGQECGCLHVCCSLASPSRRAFAEANTSGRCRSSDFPAYRARLRRTACALDRKRRPKPCERVEYLRGNWRNLFDRSSFRQSGWHRWAGAVVCIRCAADRRRHRRAGIAILAFEQSTGRSARGSTKPKRTKQKPAVPTTTTATANPKRNLSMIISFELF